MNNPNEERRTKKLDNGKIELYVHNKDTETTVIKVMSKDELKTILTQLKSKSDDFTMKRMYVMKTVNLFDKMDKDKLEDIKALAEKIQLANKYTSYNQSKDEADRYKNEVIDIKNQIDEIEGLIKD